MLETAGTAEVWKVRPSELLEIADPYVAYCVDEAAAWVINTIKLGKKKLRPIEPGGEGKPGRKDNEELLSFIKAHTKAG